MGGCSVVESFRFQAVWQDGLREDCSQSAPLTVAIQ